MRAARLMLLAISVLALAHQALASAPICTKSTPTSLTVTYANDPDMDLHYVALAATNGARPTQKPFALVTGTSFPIELKGLHPSTTYTIMVRSHPKTEKTIAWGPGWQDYSAPVNCTTKPAEGAQFEQMVVPMQRTAPGSRFLNVYRISEYSFDVDFLENHDSASLEAMPLYIMTCDPMGNCGPWTVGPKWDACQATLTKVCPSLRGAAFDCIACAEKNRDAVTTACGEFTSKDSMDGEGSFPVHWHCGVGWPESVTEEGPITEYCVEYLPVADGKDEGGDGFSGYLSCNSDEVDGLLHNDPRDPSCMCIVYDDRMLAHQTIEDMKPDCFVGEIPWVNETICNCSGAKSPVPNATNPSLFHVGRAPVYMPYVGINNSVPKSKYTNIYAGYNYHFPREAACPEGAPLGTNGCTWRRHSQARMLYGADLVAAGWDRTFVPDTPTNVSHTQKNQAAFVNALKNLDSLVMPCGVFPEYEMPALVV
eukprot:gnl/MRDRNA2_/MRDRNA2_27201_c0_seq1.p1 gnl/MRDRNA2_/MRDRNA2_27201_c0~~gnl/MRDRNA2_/MRDRNA2_27201_c0_seq1.p1  ORF type:complete len:481 (+),score=78.77 gnl/MRDRNA2_/MRDRNA2_27201_c0_seq1:63-1505(+)